MPTSQSTLVEIIGAIGRADFAAVTAKAVCELMDFELSAIVVHRRETPPALLFENFDTVGCRQGVQNYVGFTHAANPLLERGPVAGAFRARDFQIRADRIAADARSYLVRSPDEELGFRTVGWPARLEEVGLYFPACGGMVELGLYRDRGRASVQHDALKDLEALSAPIAAAFDRSATLVDAAPPQRRTFHKSLTPREAEIADLLLIGCSSEAIELRLGISRHTVKDYRKQIYRKLGIGTLSELFALGAGSLAHPLPSRRRPL